MAAIINAGYSKQNSMLITLPSSKSLIKVNDVD